jgi:hypothetical protein
MSLFRLWHWIRAAVLEFTGVTICLMLLGLPLIDRAESHNGIMAPTSSQSSIAERIRSHRKDADSQRLRHFLADILRGIIDGGG